MPLLAAPAVAGLMGLASCRTTESKRPVQPESPVVHRAAAERAWDVLVGGDLVGHVVHFSSEDAPEQSVYMVRNDYDQDLGWVDHLGRAYRLLPHHRDPAWVGTGTVSQGVERILRIEGEATMVEVSLENASDGGPPSS